MDRSLMLKIVLFVRKGNMQGSRLKQVIPKQAEPWS